MSDLIERVARAAGWETYHPYVGITLKGDMTLAAEGLVLLLRELLEAGWHLGKEGNRFIAATTASRRTSGYVFHFGPTLEEAVMLAYLAHRREK